MTIITCGRCGKMVLAEETTTGPVLPLNWARICTSLHNRWSYFCRDCRVAWFDGVRPTTDKVELYP
jgi:hypothetical protein